MTHPTNNTQVLRSESPPASRSRYFAIWGFPLTALGLSLLAAALVWSKGENFGLPSKDARISALLWIGGVMVAVILAHSLAFVLGAYQVAARLFHRETGDKPQAVASLKRDSRLQYLYEELRTSHGWRWRSRMPWLMVAGSDERVNEVAPGLKQAGVMHVADTILVHAAPGGIDAALWRNQIRQLRPRRAVDSLVQVVRMGDGIRADNDLPRMLAAIATDLGWAAPITFLHTVSASGLQPERFEAVGAFVAHTRQTMQSAAGALGDDLIQLEQCTAYAGVRLCSEPPWIRYLAEVSAYIGGQRDRIVESWRSLIASAWLRAPLAGVMFAPVFDSTGMIPVPVATDGAAAARQTTVAGRTAEAAPAAVALRAQPVSLAPAWEAIGRHARRHHGKRVGFYWPNALAALVTVAAIGWCLAMIVSLIGNRHLIQSARASVDAALSAAPGTPAALRAQLALQQQIGMLEYRQQHSAPWYLHAGLNRNDDILAALWQPYQTVASRNLQRPVAQAFQAQLVQLSQVRADALQDHDTQQRGYNALKAYLMLAEPRRADPAFLINQIVAAWPASARMPTGEWLDTSQRLAGFYADHLKAHPEWRINASVPLVTTARNTLVNQIGLANADDTVYQIILNEAKGQYADASLTALLAGADAHGLFITTQTVPGIYTRAAWDGMIAEAIDKAASERRVSGDWVLTGAQPTRTVSDTLVQEVVRTQASVDKKRTAEDLKQRLTARYFAEYTAAWQGMLNSIQWQPASNLNGAIDQLTRLTDAQTSPLIALMKSVQYQAQAGRPSQALTDTLVRKAQSLISDDDKTQAAQANPLDKPFGPLLALMGDTDTADNGNKGSTSANVAMSGVSLSHFLTAATTMRLKLQQIDASPDAQAMARSLAQAVFQGKLSELSQARDDAALMAASLGTQWAGFGDALFARPLEGAWQTILQPAAASLNEAWRASVAAPFNAAMNARYPFFDTNADASFAELGRYVRPDTGLIARFIATQLAGGLKPQGDQWVPNELAPQALQFDPRFLASMQLLSTLGAQAYAQGDAGYRFEIMALPSANVTRTELNVDGKPLVYFNQQESWTALRWPGDGLNGRTGLMWQMVNAGLRQAFDASGDWAFLRLLAQAQIKPLDSTRYQLTWEQPDAAPLRYVLRTQVGAGPLDLLKLRGFRMPERIFVVGKAGAVPLLPPLPPELQ